MTSYGKTRDALASHRLAPSKRFGQNFLVHRHTAEAIVRAGNFQDQDSVVEVGVGLAALTQPLAATVRQVIGIEIDSGIVRFHQQENDLPENVILLHQDILKSDFSELVQLCGARLKIIANLPYSISNPFIFKLIENREHVSSATIMLQKEVAERLLAAPGAKEYGIPTVLLQHCADIRKIMTLGPGEFHPRPKVDSVVIRIDFRGEDAAAASAFSPAEYDLFVKIVRASFGQRRKTILNTLAAGRVMPEMVAANEARLRVEEAIAAAGLSPQLRPEALSIQDFEELARVFCRQCRDLSQGG